MTVDGTQWKICFDVKKLGDDTRLLERIYTEGKRGVSKHASLSSSIRRAARFSSRFVVRSHMATVWIPQQKKRGRLLFARESSEIPCFSLYRCVYSSVKRETRARSCHSVAGVRASYIKRVTSHMIFYYIVFNYTNI